MNEVGGKYLTFSLKSENYGIPIGTVQQIIAMMPFTTVPKTPEFMKGVINLRGKIIPIMDLRIKLGIVSKEYSDRTCIVVVNFEKDGTAKQMGLAVDTVSEVIDIKEEEIEPFSNIDTRVDGDFIVGIGKIKEKVYMLLHVEKILSNEEMKIISDIGGVVKNA